MSLFTLEPPETALLIVDMQEKIFAQVDRGLEILKTLCQLVKAFQILSLPILISEQYPEGLGKTIQPLQEVLGSAYQPWSKSTFSCLDDKKMAAHIDSLPYSQWVVVGIESHICVLQTVKSLLLRGKKVVVPNDTITSRSIYDFSTAIAEMRDNGARISCAETILFELLKDSNHPKFALISALIKTPPQVCLC